MLCAIWYHLHNLKNVKNAHGGVLLLVSNTPPWVFFTLFKLYKWYQIAQRTTNVWTNQDDPLKSAGHRWSIIITSFAQFPFPVLKVLVLNSSPVKDIPLLHRCFLVNFAKFFTTPFSIENLRALLKETFKKLSLLGEEEGFLKSG